MQKDNTVKKIAEYKDKSLLIVDDDNPFRDRLARAMEKKGFKVTQAESVKKGIENVKLIKPAFAVIDLRLTDGNGLEVVKEIQKSNELDKASLILEAASYQRILERGFALVTDQSGKTVSAIDTFPGARLGVRFYDGDVHVEVTSDIGVKTGLKSSQKLEKLSKKAKENLQGKLL